MKEHKFAALLSYVNLGLTNLTGILVTPYVIRSLGNQEYGLYTLIGAFVGYLSVLDLGLNNAIVRYVAQYRVQKDEKAQENFLATSLIIYCAIAALLAILGSLFYFNIDYFFSKSLSVEELYKAKIMLIILVFNIAFTLPGGAFTGICSGYEKFVFPRILSIIKVVIRTITLVCILHYGSNSIGVVILDTIVNLVFILATIWYVFSKLKIKIKLHQWDFSFVKEIFKYSFWIFLFALVFQFQWRTGQVILGSTTNTTIVAIFGVGVMLGVYFTTFGNIINGLLLPKAVQSVYNNASNEVLTNQMIKVGRISYLLLIYVFGAFLLTGQDFIKLWVGELYLPSYWIALSIMAVYIIPIAQGYSHAILDAKKMLRFKSLNFLLFSVIGAISGYFLSKNYGMYGMITGLVSAIFLLQIVMNVYYQFKLKLNMPKFFKAIFKITLLTVILIIINKYILSYFNFQLSWFIFMLKNVSFSFFFFLVVSVAITEEEKNIFLDLNREMSSISIIISSYNSENTILETLESVVNQTSSKWECVIVDDYSEDKTIELVNEFIKKNSGFKLVQKSYEVKGANSSRNLGVQFSKNNYISFIDSDDVLDKKFVFNRLKEVDNLNQPEVVFFPNYSRFKDDISKSISITNYKNYNTTISIVNDYLLMQEPLPFIISSGVWKREMFKTEPVFNENYKRLQDVEMIIRFLLNEPSFKIINNNPDYYYRYEVDSNKIKQKRFLYIESSIMLYKDLILNFNTIEPFKRWELLKNLKRFANKSLKTIYLSKQFDYVFFKKTLEEFKQSDSSISFKFWSFFSFLKKIRMSDMPIVNNVLFRIIK